MSERNDEEMVEQGSVSGSSGSSGSEPMVELEESPLQEEEEHGNHSGNSDSSKVLSDEAQLNLGDVPAPTLIVNESTVSVVVQTEAVAADAGGGDSEGGLEVNGDGSCEESNKVEESNHVEESKDASELKDEASEGIKDNVNVVVDDSMNVAGDCAVPVGNGVKEETPMKQETPTMSYAANTQGFNYSYPSTLHMSEEDNGTEEEQIAFLREVETFCRERSLDFKHPKFYGEGLNCLKLWRAVTRLGGYDRVTACKLWRQVGESFHPPKTCTTVSWSFRIFYEKSLLDYERHKLRGGEFVMPPSSHPEAPSAETLVSGQQGSGGRQRRDAAARAMEGWHFRLHGNGEDKNSLSAPKREKQVKSVGGLLKRKKPSSLDRSVKAARTVTKVSKPQIDTDVIDVGTPAADWVKINVLRTKDCFEVYALVPGLLREEVRVQSDPIGRLVISGDPEQPDNPWGVTPFKKVITLPSRIDPHQTSAVVTLHGQLFVRVPFEQNDL